MSKYFHYIGYGLVVAGGVLTSLGVSAPIGVAVTAIGAVFNHLAPAPVKKP